MPQVTKHRQSATVGNQQNYYSTAVKRKHLSKHRFKFVVQQMKAAVIAVMLLK